MLRRKPWPTALMIHWYHEDQMSLQEISDVLSSDFWQFYWRHHTGAEYRPRQKIVNKHLKKHTKLRKTGAPLHRNYFWAGGRTVDKHGYILVKSPEHPMATAAGYVREHRLIMESMLGRMLLPTEVVHHRDDNKQNNALENLQLFSSQAEHIATTMQGKVPSSRIHAAHEARMRYLKAGSRNGKRPEHDDQESPRMPSRSKA